MKILAISDMHGQFNKFDYRKFPDYDILVIAGDFTNLGDCIYREILEAKTWLNNIIELNRGMKREILVISGNHDLGVPCYKGHLGYIIDMNYNFAIVKGLSFYGIPLTTCYDMPELAGRWIHMTHNTMVEKEAFDFQPVDIVISHGPPYGILDNVGRSGDYNPIGSQELRKYIVKNKPKLVICGHIHECPGVEKYENTYVYNVARRAVLIDTDKLGNYEVISLC